MMGSNRLKTSVGIIILLVLVLLNLQKYLGDNSAPTSRQRYQDVTEMTIPTALTERSDVDSSRDIFVRLEIDENSAGEPKVESVIDDPEPPKEAVGEKIAKISSYEDVRLLGVSVRSGVSMALIRFEGRSYYVAVGDVVGGRYFIEGIDESGVYASTR